MEMLADAITWQTIPIGAGAAFGNMDLVVGEIGSGQPIGLVTAGIHGDEGPWGALAIHKFLRNTRLDELVGTLRLIPNANPLAMQADSRNAPLDVLDLNRVFPGDKSGSHTERLAAAIVENALNDVDVVIDLHGGGSWCVNAFVFRFEGGGALSEAFGAPFMIDGPDRAVTLTGYARSKGAKVAAVEMGGRSAEEEAWAERISKGLRRSLGISGVLNRAESSPDTQSILVNNSSVLRPNQGGIFIPTVGVESVGTIVDKDTQLGKLLNPNTHEVLEVFTAPFDRTAIMLLRPHIARVEGGAMTYVVAEPLE